MRNRLKKFISNKKSFIFFIILLIFIIVSLYGTYQWIVVPNSQKNYYYLENNVSDNNVEITKGEIITQTFIAEKNTLSAFDLKFSSINQHTCLIFVTLKNITTEKVIQSWTINAKDIQDGHEFLLFEQQKNIKNNKFEIIISTDDASVGNSITILSSKTNTYENGELFINNIKEAGDLNFSVRDNETYNFIELMYIIFSILIILAFITFYYLIFLVKIRIEKAFVLIALFLGILYMIVLPAYSAPDEQRHMITSYKYSSIILQKPVYSEDGKVIIEQSDGKLILPKAPDKKVYKQIYDSFFNFRPDNIMVERGELPVEGTPLAYLPQTLGIALARILNLGFIPLFYMGRFFNLLFFVFTFYFAIKIIPYNKMVLSSVALLPMTMELASSLSYDATAISVSALFIAYILKLIHSSDNISKKDIVILSVIFLWVSPIKFVYSTLILLFLAIPKNKIKFKRKIIIIFLLLIFTLIFTLILNLNSFSGISNNAEKVISWSNSPGYTIDYLIHNPIVFIKVIINTFRLKSEFYLLTMIGKLGWLEIQIPITLLVAFIVVLLISTVGNRNQNIYLNNRQRLWGIVAIIGTILLLEVSMLLGWTPLSYNYVEGVQGRYFLPILALPLILLNNKNIIIKKNFDGYLLITILFLQINTLLFTFEVIASR